MSWPRSNGDRSRRPAQWGSYNVHAVASSLGTSQVSLLKQNHKFSVSSSQEGMKRSASTANVQVICHLIWRFRTSNGSGQVRADYASVDTAPRSADVEGDKRGRFAASHWRHVDHLRPPPIWMESILYMRRCVDIVYYCPTILDQHYDVCPRHTYTGSS
jgi:hypothetical protein